MHTLIGAAALALALQQSAALATGLAAQGNGDPTQPTHPGCSLVTEQEVETATGLDYSPGTGSEPEYEWIKGGATCLWGGPSMVDEDRPEIHVTFLAASAGGSYTERQSKQRPRTECTRESVSDVGDRAFVDVCPDGIFDASVYARTGNHDVLVRVYEADGMPKASVKPAAIALAKAAAARAKGM